MFDAAPRPVAIVPERLLSVDPATVADYAKTVEALGYSGIICKDHVVLGSEPDGNNGYTNEHSFLEPLTLFSFIAGQTEKIQMITGVLVLPQRQTPLVAKQTQMVSDLSKGRFILGVGAGSNATEFAAMGEDIQGRGARTNDQIIALRSLWKNQYNDYAIGREVGNKVGINPRPQYDIPIWIGGWAPPVLERAARLAEGWAPMGHPDDAKSQIPILRGLLEKHGRNPDNFDILGAFGTPRRDTQTPNSPEARAETMEKWMDLGATAIAYGQQRSTGNPAEDLKWHLEDLARHITHFEQVTGYSNSLS